MVALFIFVCGGRNTFPLTQFLLFGVFANGVNRYGISLRKNTTMQKKKTHHGWQGIEGCNLDQRNLINIRPLGNGTAIVTGKPEAITYLEPSDAFVGSDKRGEREYFFITRQGNLLLLGFISSTGGFEFVEKDYGNIGNISDFSVSGDFIIISTDSGLKYLYFSNNDYEFLGNRIEFPELSFGTVNSSDISVKMPAVTLVDTYSTWAGDLLPHDKETLTKLTKSAFNQIKQIAKTEMRFIQPVLIKVALRLFDGSLLWSPDTYFVGEGYAQVNTLAAAHFSANGVSAIASADIKVKAWKPSVSIIQPGLGAWRKVVKAVEIYSTEEQDTLATPSFRCETSQTGDRLNSLRIMSDKASVSHALKTLPELDKYKLLATISNIDAFMKGKLVPLEEATGVVHTISKNTTYKVEAITSGKPATPREPIFPSRAEVLSTIANKCFAGNIGYSLPQPQNYLSLCSLKEVRNEMASVNIAVDVITSSGKKTIAYASLMEAWSPSLLPVITYPDPRAVKITILATVAGKGYRFSTDLQPSSSGEFAYAISSNLEKFRLAETANMSQITSDDFIEWKAADLLVSGNGNPMIWQRCDKAHNKGVIAISPAFGYGSSWLLGRHSAYLFAIDGIYLLSFDKNGCSGATLVSQRQAKSSKTVTATTKAIAFADKRNNICILSGNKESPIGISVSDVSAVGYSLLFDEILLQTVTGISAIAKCGLYHKQFGNMELATVGENAFFTDRNFIYSVDKEIETIIDVEAKSGSFDIPEGKYISTVDWNVISPNASIVLTVYGDNGIRCHGEKISSLTAKGYIGYPIRHRLPFAIKRTARFEVKGTLPSFTQISPTAIEIKQI